MPSYDDVYRKFGQSAEAAQLLETELGTLLLIMGCLDADLLYNPDPEKAMGIYNKINCQTMGQLLRNANISVQELEPLKVLLTTALKSRNDLSHSFFRRHNFRIHSERGRGIMMDDLGKIHANIFEAYKAVMRIMGDDLDDIWKHKIAGSAADNNNS
jgi:hypothetical protein